MLPEVEAVPVASTPEREKRQHGLKPPTKAEVASGRVSRVKANFSVAGDISFSVPPKVVQLSFEKLGRVRRRLAPPVPVSSRSLALGALAGAVAGLVGAWAMSEFADASSRWFHLNRTARRRGHKPLGSQEEMDVTIGLARLLVQGMLPGVTLSRDQEYRAAVAVHYSAGAALGVSYGVLAEVVPSVTAGTGTLFTAAEWGIGEFVVPLLPFMKSSYPASVRLHALAGHIALGLTMELTRRATRATISRSAGLQTLPRMVF